MVKRWILVIIGAVLPIAFTHYGWTVTLDDVAREIEDLQKEIKNCEGKFLIFVRPDDEEKPSSTDVKVRRGNIWFKSPSFWRIELYDRETSVQRSVVVCDGTNFWYYYPEQAKVTKKSVVSLSADEIKDLVLRMTGKTPLINIVKYSRESVISVEENATDQTWRLELAPNEYFSQRMPFEYDKINITFGIKDGLMRELKIFRKGEAIYSVIFYKLRTDSPISEDKFIFQPPEGVEIEEVR